MEISEKIIKLQILGIFSGIVDLENISGKVNFNLNNNIPYITVLDKSKNLNINQGDIINAKIIKHHVKFNKSPVFECDIDLNNLKIIPYNS